MRKERIVVAVNEDAVASLIQRSLESLGYGVAGPVASAQEAIAEARRFRLDLVCQYDLKGDRFRRDRR